MIRTKKRVGGGFKIIEIEQAKDCDKEAEEKSSNSITKELSSLKLPKIEKRSNAASDSSELESYGYDDEKQDEGNEKEDTNIDNEVFHLPSLTSSRTPSSYVNTHRSYQSYPSYQSAGKHCVSEKAWNVPGKKPSTVYDANPVLRFVKDNVVGHDTVIVTPYGQRKIVYCDYTASGRCLTFIEDYVRSVVMPTYANTHSRTGHNARQTGHFREEARNTIKNCVNANTDDVVIFTGSGATAAMHKVAWALKINTPHIARETVVFTGPYEHHSNILLWREYGTHMIRIRQESETGMIDVGHLQQELEFWKGKRRQMLVCMSAASNVTGIITDVNVIARIAHQHGALAIFDYAGGGPYLEIDMNPSRTEYKDAIVISPHKFVGGPGTPGVLVAKKWVFRNKVPDRVGGGTVRFVTRAIHAYVTCVEEREEGGTPAIIESIRAGLVFKLKQEIGADVIHQRERELCDRAFAVWEANPCIHILGSHREERLPIFSFLTIHQETGRLVHHDFIAALLSDVFGIQSRAGCACAGPYAEDLLGIPESLARQFISLISDQPSRYEQYDQQHIPLLVTKPGFTRINLSFFFDDETADFVIDAVDMVTRYGWKLLPQYTFDIRSGVWKHRSFSNQSDHPLASLQACTTSWRTLPNFLENTTAPQLKEVLLEARRMFDEADYTGSPRLSSASLALREALPSRRRRLRWFVTPYDAALQLSVKDESSSTRKLYKLPFNFMRFPNRFKHTEKSDSTGRNVHSTEHDGHSTGHSGPSTGRNVHSTGHNGHSTGHKNHSIRH